MKILLKQNPEDTVILGIIRHIITAFITYIIELAAVTVFFMYVKFNNQILKELIYIVIIPAAFIISGIYNTFILWTKSFHKASKTNLIITVLVFIASSTVYLIIINQLKR